MPKKPEENPTKTPKNASPTNIYANFKLRCLIVLQPLLINDLKCELTSKEVFTCKRFYM